MLSQQSHLLTLRTELLSGLLSQRDEVSRGFIVYGVTSALHHLTSPASPLSSSVAGTSVSHGSPSVASLENTTSYPLESGWRRNLPHLSLPGGTWDDGLHDHVLDTFFAVYNKYVHHPQIEVLWRPY